MKFILFLVFSLFFNPIFAQKQKYWQQKVHYQIQAQLDDQKDALFGNYQLKYYNQSPYVLQEIYFHLNENAFQPKSYYHQLLLGNKTPVIFGKNEKDGLGMIVKNVLVNGEAAATELDNTILKIELNEALSAGDSVTINLQFETYFGEGGSLRRRMKMFKNHGFKHYNGTHWYPVACVYDRNGWDLSQHLDKEFYANFGTFEVEITAPNDYILGGTGILKNESEVLPDTLKRKLDLNNFAKKAYNSPPSIPIIREEGKTKTWKFKAEKVHNFAFVAAPTYRIKRVKSKLGIIVEALIQESNAPKNQETAELTAYIIDFYSEKFGKYEYPKFTVADAQDGTEYGMMAIITGIYPYNVSLIAHETAHQWFYGMLANNETYRAFLDEGFADLMTTEFQNLIYGEENKRVSQNKVIDRAYDLVSNTFSQLYYGYLQTVNNGYDMPLNTHSSDFRNAIRQGGGYNLVYQKGGVMLSNLHYVLGNDLFYKALRNYVQEWKFAHPYPEDLRQSFIHYTKTDLNWFFDQWLETTKKIDYKIQKVKHLGNFKYEIYFRRIGEQQMPLEFQVTDKSGQTDNFYIPNTSFQKKPEKPTTILPKWYGWGKKLNPIYKATVELDDKIKKIEIDPTERLADIDRSDNVWHKGFPPILFDVPIKNAAFWRSYKHFWRPAIWYNSYDGFQFGVNFRGEYFANQKTYNFAFWYNSGLANQTLGENLGKTHQKIAFSFENRGKFIKNLENYYESSKISYLAGLYKHEFALERTFRPQDEQNPNAWILKIEQKTMYRFDNNYLNFRELWANEQANASINISLRKTYKQGEWRFYNRLPAWASVNYSYISTEWLHNSFSRFFNFRTRFFARHTFGNAPLESALYWASANPEQQFDNRFTQAENFYSKPFNSLTDNHLHSSGGLNLRGFSRMVSSLDSANFANSPLRSGASVNLEMDLDKIAKMKFKIKDLQIDNSTYLFVDAGFGLNQANKVLPFRANAGIGTAINFRFNELTIKPLTIRFDVPFWVNTSQIDGKEFAFRWLLGFERRF